MYVDISKFFNSSKSGVDSDGSCPSCDHDYGNPIVNVTSAVVGGVFVINSYLANAFFKAWIDPFAIELSALIGAVILALPILISAVRDLLGGKVYMNELVALALLAAFASEDYRTAGLVAFFMLITITIEHKTAVGAEASLESLVKLTPRRARRLEDGREVDVDVQELRVGDVVRVRPGENFPADGVVVQGTSAVNQASITGESLPLDKSLNDDVFAGTQNLTGAVEFKINRLGKDTTLGKVRELIAAAEKSKLPFMRMVDRYAGYYTPSILMIAALVWFVTGEMSRVIAVLVIACPCAVVLATPSALIAALAAAARLGVLIKDVTHIELISKINAMVFDKTGTLTEGNLEVGRLQPAEGVELAELLQTAVSAECHSNHPAAEAMRKLAEEAEITWEDPSSYEEFTGRGVVANFGDDVYRVGRAPWLAEYGIDTKPLENKIEEDGVAGMSIIFVACNKRLLGWVGLRDAIREAAGASVSRLEKLGIKRCCMVTGDNQSVAEMVARKIGIKELQYGCLPQEKVAFVDQLRNRNYTVGVVGDGVNDAPALAAGDVGIAMGAIGSDVAVHSASIALMNNDLRRIPFLVLLSRQTRRVMNQNLLLGLIFIVAGVYFSTVGIITPVLAAFLHSVSTLLLIFNSARLLRAGEELHAPAALERESANSAAPEFMPRTRGAEA